MFSTLWFPVHHRDRLIDNIIVVIIVIIPAAITDYFLICIQVSIDHNSGIFITMNPAGKGYGGRQKLPDNLKQLFRPVAMSKPDNDLIAEVILFSEGFKHAKALGRKLVSVFTLSKWVHCKNLSVYFLGLCILLKFICFDEMK